MCLSTSLYNIQVFGFKCIPRRINIYFFGLQVTFSSALHSGLHKTVRRTVFVPDTNFLGSLCNDQPFILMSVRLAVLLLATFSSSLRAADKK